MQSLKQKGAALGLIVAATIACGQEVASENADTRVAAVGTSAGAIVGARDGGAQPPAARVLVDHA